MNSEMIKFFLGSGVPSGFVDSEGELEMNNSLLNLLHSLIYTPEMKPLIERVQSEKSLFSLISLLLNSRRTVSLKLRERISLRLQIDNLKHCALISSDKTRGNLF